MALPGWTDYNKIKSRKAFDVLELVCAFHYTSKPYFEPYYESYDFSQIFLVIKGDGIYTADGKSYPISDGMMFYRPSQQKSMYEWYTDECELALISFVCDSEAARAFHGAPIPLYEEEIAALIDIIKTTERICLPIKETEPLQGMKLRPDVPDVVVGFISSSLERFLSMVYCRIKGIELVIDESRKAGDFIRTSRLVSELKRYLTSNAHEKLSISALCTEFGIGQTSLMKKFKADTGLTVMEYFTKAKVERAKELISSSTLNFSEISDALSFSSANYFSRVFKEKTGMTPTEYGRYVSKRKNITK